MLDILVANLKQKLEKQISKKFKYLKFLHILSGTPTSENIRLSYLDR